MHGGLLPLELHRPRHHLLAHESLDVTPFDDELAPMRHAHDGRLEIRQVKGLDEIFHRALRERLDGRLRLVDPTDHHDGEIGIELEGAWHHVQPGHVRHADIAEHGHEALLLEHHERRRSRLTGVRVVAALP